MSITAKAQKVRNALASIQGLNCYHLEKPSGVTAPYCVWQEDDEGDSHYSDNGKSEQVLQLTVDYYTKTEYDPMTDSIQSALNCEDITWKLNSFQYENETKLLHYEWLVKVI